MNFAGVPEPWGTILQLLVGPVGAIIAMAAIIFFLWRLFREEQEDNRDNKRVIATLSDTVRDLATELHMWREIHDATNR